MTALTASCDSSMDGAFTAALTVHFVSDAVDAVEQSASKRRRLDHSAGGSPPCEESAASRNEPLAGNEQILEQVMVQHPQQPATPALHCTASVRAKDGVDRVDGSSSSDSAISAATAPEEATQDGLVPPKTVYPCRTVGCGASLSSTSNRRRHERKHQVASEPAHPVRPVSATVRAQPEPVHPALGAIPRRSVKRSAPASAYVPPRSPVVQPVMARKRAPMPDALRILDDRGDESEGTESKDEQEDLELLRYLGSSRPAFQQRSFGHRVAATSPCSDEDKSGPVTPGSRGVSSGSEASRMDDDVAIEDEPVPGMPLLLSDADMQAGCFDFLRWLTLPPLTQFESQCKLKRVKTMAALQPIRCNLRFVFTLLSSKQVTNKVDLHELTSLETCQTLFDALGERGVGSARTHAIALLVKKALVFLSTTESTARKQFLPPTMYDSFLYVEGICCANSLRRKQESRNRALLGLHASKQLAQGSAHQASKPFSIPTTWSSDAPDSASSPTGRRADVGPASSPASLAPPAASSCNELSKAELQQVTKGCLASLRELMTDPSGGDVEAQKRSLRWFQSLLATCMFCLGLAPRSQILKQLRLGTTFTKHADDQKWWASALADMSKNGRPVLFSFPEILTPIIDFFIAKVRPRLLAPAVSESSESSDHMYLFVKFNGSAPRTDFSGLTSAATQYTIGRPVNAHAFRSAVM